VEGLVGETQFNRAALSVTVSEGDPAVVTAVGEVDISTVKALEDGLEAAAGDPVEHDVDAELDGVGFMGAAGVRALVTADEEIARGGHRFRIRSVSKMVRRVLDLLGFHHLIRPRR
jgi:anti-anti-sigma factor